MYTRDICISGSSETYIIAYISTQCTPKTSEANGFSETPFLLARPQGAVTRRPYSKYTSPYNVQKFRNTDNNPIQKQTVGVQGNTNEAHFGWNMIVFEPLRPLVWYFDIWHICLLPPGWHPVAVVQYTFTHKQHKEKHIRHKQYIEHN